MPAPIEIRFELTRDDFLKFVRHSANNDPHMLGPRRRIRRQLLTAFVLIAVVLSIVTFLRTSSTGPGGTPLALWSRVLVSTVFGVGLAGVWYGVTLLLPLLFGALRGGAAGQMVRHYRIAIDRGEIDPELGTHVLSASDEGLFVQTPRSSIAEDWEHLHLVEIDWAFLVYRGKNSAYIVPKAAFVSPAAVEQFRKAMQDWMPPGRTGAESMVRRGG